MNMKSYKSISIALLTALSLYPPWAGVQTCNAQTNTTNTNLYRARVNLVCTTPNANGNLVHDRIITSEFVQDSVSVGATNLDDLALAYNPSNNSLEVVNRSTREVVSTPLRFEGGTSLANSDNTRVVLQTSVFLNSDTVASGLLSATQRLVYADSGELRSFGMRGSIFYSFTDGTNSPTVCQGVLAVGSSISQRGGNQDFDDDNNGNQGNRGNNGSTNVLNPGFGTTNVNRGGFGTTNINRGALGAGVNQGLTANQGFGTGVNQGLTANQGVGTGIGGVNQGFGTSINQGTGLGTGITGANQSFGTSLNQGTGLGTTINRGAGTGVTQP